MPSVRGIRQAAIVLKTFLELSHTFTSLENLGETPFDILFIHRSVLCHLQH